MGKVSWIYEKVHDFLVVLLYYIPLRSKETTRLYVIFDWVWKNQSYRP